MTVQERNVQIGCAWLTCSSDLKKINKKIRYQNTESDKCKCQYQYQYVIAEISSFEFRLRPDEGRDRVETLYKCFRVQGPHSVPAPWAGNGGPGPSCESLVPALDQPAE